MTFEENIGTNCIINGETLPSDALNQYSDEKYSACYEVIRIIKGTPLFYDDHFSRLKSSVQKTQNELEITKRDLKAQIHKICELNKFTDCNVKVLVLLYEKEQITLLHINKFYYPSQEEYDSGVKSCTVKLSRNNPSIKMVNTSYKAEVKRVAEANGAFEVLLVNDSNRITEGGKSNVFFVKGDKIYTSPEEYILKGITRQYIIDVCVKLGYEVIETLISVEQLSNFDAAFITGTSINAMPLKIIDSCLLNSAENAVTQNVMKGYNSLVSAYIESNRNKN
ncbi:aminotransferase class IV [Ruminiclostridium cellulolyticum]|uniref:Aminotransferase class IV n=1 Tax=Ruminiclostridium cellulolyticum (strain ATCC 35319 / DSM 5812 / JCM 6584 / H10) TaxID=394503 RepID=B8I309_RUMCH|nr:aminotransferase class IV [Ruminiclostridium cellulolyticum]ACL76152.1 aminotransferase class IV [Ruminiclostridium cellulolyticum H10]